MMDKGVSPAGVSCNIDNAMYYCTHNVKMMVHNSLLEYCDNLIIL